MTVKMIIMVFRWINECSSYLPSVYSSKRSDFLLPATRRQVLGLGLGKHFNHRTPGVTFVVVLQALEIESVAKTTPNIS